MTLLNVQPSDALLEAARAEELQNAKILDNVWFFTIGFSLIMIGLIVITSVALKNRKAASFIVITLLMAILLVGLSYAYKIEIDTGYYQCQSCEHKFVPDYGEAFFRAKFDIPRRMVRHLECPECGDVTWAKKVLSK